ncbi:hypothetical protein EV138_4251 [Kribbella voronezhensis]|uniref:DUF2637 domain-containing protein n=1 Tax=Kribbella voronezhensis TaxID=2512212 RepID=A0A4R7TFQ0_9ACTN|nr:hypothetical protein [Kribbella voronezhensis]TDU90659.1 hypothetical protein EV138_4251 [Kribbella voronezhensis]
MQENTTSTSTGELANVPLTGADKVAYAFYATAATAALVGQVWAGVTHIPWPDEGFSPFLKIALVTPAVAVIELGGVATAALADLRRRKGEQAYAYRAMSLFAAIVALVFNVVGHWRPEERFLAFGFGGLSAFAYVLWLIHSSARRRDALRKAGQMATTGPVYGVVQWAREPKVTWLARSIALEHGYGLYESLRAARHQIRNNARRDAIAGTVAEYIRSEHQDERLAKIAETTYDADRLAGMLEERINYEVVTNKLTLAISPPPPEEPEPTPAKDERTDLRAAVWVVEGTTPPVQQLPAHQVPAQQLRPGGVPLRDDDQWGEAMTGELMAVEYLPYDRSTDDADEAEVVEEAPSSLYVKPVVQETSPFAPVVPEPVAPAVPQADLPGAQQSAAPSVASSVASSVAQPVASSVAQPVAEQEHVVPAAPKPAVVKPSLPKPAAARKPKTVVRNSVPSSTAPVPAVEEPVVVASQEPAVPAGSEPVRAEEPTVIAREVTARTTPNRPAAPKPKTSAGGDLDKKRQRAWALLSDWPSDRPRTPEVLASAIASSNDDAAAFIVQYDAENNLATANQN